MSWREYGVVVVCVLEKKKDKKEKNVKERERAKEIGEKNNK